MARILCCCMRIPHDACRRCNRGDCMNCTETIDLEALPDDVVDVLTEHYFPS